MLGRFLVALVLGAIFGVRTRARAKRSRRADGNARRRRRCDLRDDRSRASLYHRGGIGAVPDPSTVNAGVAIIANIVVGIGFLGAGLIIKTNDHIHGVTTAALVWATAAIGVLAGIGLIQFAAAAALILALLLFFLRKLKVSEYL